MRRFMAPILLLQSNRPVRRVARRGADEKQSMTQGGGLSGNWRGMLLEIIVAKLVCAASGISLFGR